jgi:hypothetical protein
MCSVLLPGNLKGKNSQEGKGSYVDTANSVPQTRWLPIYLLGNVLAVLSRLVWGNETICEQAIYWLVVRILSPQAL